ncbi:MAG: hypothetical protein D6795_15670 [Deltaproteobacteria bacterium]|nr:MAG: hypothetical protein D6795_15670 [Deltaproteobacteria bacterium]
MCYQNEHFGPLLPLALFTKRAFIPVARPPQWPALKVVCLEEIGEEEILQTRNPALIAMLPLCAVPRKEVRSRAGSWRAAIETNAPDEARTKEAIALLAAFLGHRFPRLTLQELNGWLGGLPMEDTALGRDLIEIGRRSGLEQGLQQERILILSLAKRRFGRVTKRLERALARLDSPEKLLQAGEQLLDAESLSQFTKFVEALAR